MNNVARMVMLAKGKEDRGDRYEMNDREMRNGYDNRYVMKQYRYEPEDRFTDRRGKPHYDNGKYAPRTAKQYRMENIYRGEYEPMYGEYDGGRDPLERERKHRPPFTDPLASPMNKIGFAVGGEMERSHEMPHDYPEEMGWRGGTMEKGKAGGSSVMPITKETATQWVRGMQNEDGTMGAHWSYEQVKQLMAQKGVDCDPAEFYATINMLYSDYGKVAKKLNIIHPDYWIDMAKAFLEDKDAPEDKLARYYKYIVQA